MTENGIFFLLIDVANGCSACRMRLISMTEVERRFSAFNTAGNFLCMVESNAIVFHDNFRQILKILLWV